MKYSFTLIYTLLISLLPTAQVAVAQLNKTVPAPLHQPTPDKSLQFIQNKNQWDRSVRFMAPLPSGKLWLQDQSLVYAFYEEAKMSHQHGAAAGGPGSDVIKAHAYKVSFLQAATPVRVSGEKATSGYRNYFIGNDPARWASQVKSYQDLRYSALYPGIDMHLYEQEGHLKYDFLVAPHTDPQVIRMQYQGADQLRLEKGDLHVKTSVAEVIERKPYAYQLVNGRQVAVPCRFQLDGQVVSFVFPNGYNQNLPLVIDPTLVFSTYSGSTADNWGFTATYDQQGNMYSGGIVNNVGLPTTLGAYDIIWNGNSSNETSQTNRAASAWDVAILKFKTDGSGPASLLYATYLGGNLTEVPSSLVVNKNNELLVLGSTSSSDFPTTAGVHDRTYNGGTFIQPLGGIRYLQGSDLFVSRLDAEGRNLLASTYLGGSGNDGLLGNPQGGLDVNYGDQFRGDILTDDNNNIFLVSSTQSQNFPFRNGFQSTFGGGSTDAVIAKLTPGLTLDWSSYLGGAGQDAAYSIQIDANQNIFVAGGTSSTTLSNTAGALQPAFGGGVSDGFVAKLAPAGNVLQRLTYLGTDRYDQTYFVQLDENNDVYLLGQTLGAYPVSAGVFSTSNGKQFIHKLNNDLNTSFFSTVFGDRNATATSSYNISPTAFLIDNCNRIYVCGWGGSTINFGNGTTSGLPTTPDAYQPTTDGQDFYLMMLAKDARALEYATFFGGNGGRGEHVDGGTSRFDKRGFVYQAVCGCGGATSLFPTTPNAWSRQNLSTNCNNAAFKFDINIVTAVAGSDQTVCANAAPFQLTGFSPATGGTWSGPGVSPTGLFTPAAGLVGTLTLTYTVANGSCISTSTKVMRVNPAEPVSFTGLPPQVCLPAASFTLLPSVTGGTFSGPGISGNTFNPALAGNGTHTITYTFTNTFNCTVAASQTVQVGNTPVVNAGPNQSVCTDAAPFTLPDFSPAGGTWSGTGVTAAGVFTPSTSLVGTHTLTYTVENGFCSSSQTKTITVNALPVVSFTGLPPQICADGTTFTLVGSPAGGTFTGRGMTGNIFNPLTAGEGTHTITYAYTNAAGCTVTRSQATEVRLQPVVQAGPDERICSGSFPLMLSNFSPAGGTWSGTGVRADGLFTPSQAIVGTHVLSYTVTNGFCSVTQTKTIIVDPTIRFMQGPALAVCPDGPAFAISDISPQGGTWTGNGVSPTGIFTPTPGLVGDQLLTYFVQIGACSGISTKSIRVDAPPSINAAAVPTECGSPTNIQGFAPFSASFTNSTTGATGFLWEFGDGSTSTDATPTHKYTKDGSYEVYLTAFYGNGCRIKQKIAVALVDKSELVPNVFTPNGDGLNDTFVPRITCLPTDLKIYNRWGKLVYEQQNYQNNWGAENTTDGIYYYQLTNSKGQIWKGWVEVIR